jgi:hypothetical protein
VLYQPPGDVLGGSVDLVHCSYVEFLIETKSQTIFSQMVSEKKIKSERYRDKQTQNDDK